MPKAEPLEGRILFWVDENPLLLKADRSPAIRFDGSLMHPAPTDLWG